MIKEDKKGYIRRRAIIPMGVIEEEESKDLMPSVPLSPKEPVPDKNNFAAFMDNLKNDEVDVNVDDDYKDEFKKLPDEDKDLFKKLPEIAVTKVKK